MSDKYLSDPSDEDFEKESAPFSCGGCLLGFLCLPFCCCSIFTVQEREEVVALQCGKFKEVFRQPGLHYQTCCGRELRRVSKTKISVSLPNVKILDLTGAPLIVSGVVVYSYGNTKRVAIDVQDASSFLKNQATCVMKSVVSRYPYENWDDDPNAHTLKTEGETIAQELVDTLQRAVKLAGVTVHTFQINEISYSAEVAQGMLKKQQAEQLVLARKTIVDGACNIAHDAVSQIEKRGAKMTPEERAKLVSNLLTVVCSEDHVQPILSLN